MKKSLTMPEWLEQLQSQGRYTFTRQQVQAETGRSFVAVQTALRRLKERTKVIAPRKGFYVIVPPEYRAMGAPPASWFIHDLMTYLDRPYYVGLLSAAAIHGAAHQQPMVFQVITDKPLREIHSGKVVIQFSMANNVTKMPVMEKQTETGTMHLATPETTVFDLVRFSSSAGYLNNVATILTEISENMKAAALVKIAQLVRLPDVQRLGYLFDAIDRSDLVDPLAVWLSKKKPRAVLLNPGANSNGDMDNRWHVLPNIDLEIDL